MTPGLTGWSPEIRSGDVVQVLLPSKAAVAVGVAAFDIGQLSKAVGGRGKAIYLVHCYRDELWGLGSKSHPPEPSTDLEADSVQEKALQGLSLDSVKSPTDRQHSQDEDDIIADVAKHSSETLPGSVALEEKEPSVSGNVNNYTAKDLEIDKVFKAAAIYGLYAIKSADKQKSILLPLSSSAIIADHLIPYLPEQYTQYSFKKTSWKKAATFLKKYMEKEGVIRTKDRAGETIILSIDWNHKLITEFQPYSLSHKPTESTDSKVPKASSSVPPMVEVREFYKPTGKVLRAIIESQSQSYSKDSVEANE